MSAEIAKKRGRPKKVITEPVEVDVPEPAKKTTTRAKSTKAAPKTAKVTTSAPKASPSTKSTPEPPAKPSVARKTASKTTPATPTPSKAEPPKQPEPKPSAAAKTTPPPPKVTPETSKILHELRQQTAAKTASSPPSSPQQSAPSPTTTSAPPTQAKPPPPPASKIPLAALNKQIVGNIAGRAGARPNVGGPGGALPKNYNSVARKVTLTIVALPIALVTSWVLYERFVLGEERKLLVQPKTSPSEEASTSTPTTTSS